MNEEITIPESLENGLPLAYAKCTVKDDWGRKILHVNSIEYECREQLSLVAAKNIPMEIIDKVKVGRFQGVICNCNGWDAQIVGAFLRAGFKGTRGNDGKVIIGIDTLSYYKE